MPRSKSVKLSEKQRQARLILGGPQRHTLLVGGSRSGKTSLLVYAVLMRAARFPGSRHAILRFRSNAARNSIWLDTLPKIAQLFFPDLNLVPHERDGYMELPNGSQIWVGGLDDKERVEKILGQEYATIYFNECSQIGWLACTTALTRLAQRIPGLTQRAYYDLNPTGTTHWSYRIFIEGRSPDSMEPLATPEDYAYMYLNPEDNRENLDPQYIASLAALPERQRRRFLEGRYVAQLDGALWTLEMIEAGRVDEAPKDLMRIVVAVDPSGARSQTDYGADAIGIVAAGVDRAGDGYILEDLTGLYSPKEWARVAVNAYYRWGADRVVYERNYGGEMVCTVIQTADANIKPKEVTASRGKTVRAEPISQLYEMGKVHHVGRFPQLEDEQCNFTSRGYIGEKSPNRADAAVWALTDLMLEMEMHAGLFALWKQQAEDSRGTVDYSAKGLADSSHAAQKRDLVESGRNWLPKSDKPAKELAVTACPGCAGPVATYSETWKCWGCGEGGAI